MLKKQKKEYIGDYKIEKQLGSGAFGSAYICYHKNKSDQLFVIKQVNLEGLNQHDRMHSIQEVKCSQLFIVFNHKQT